MRLLALVLLACLSVLSAADNQLSGRRAPGFSLPDADFNRYDLQDYHGSKWVVIEFINTNCPHCRELSKALEEVKPKFDRKIQFLAVVLPPDNTATVAKYAAELNLTYPLLFDQGQMAASYFNASPKNPRFGTPHVFIIDPSGTIVRDFGHSEENGSSLQAAGLARLLEDLLSGKAAPIPMKRQSAALIAPR